MSCRLCVSVLTLKAQLGEGQAQHVRDVAPVDAFCVKNDDTSWLITFRDSDESKPFNLVIDPWLCGQITDADSSRTCLS